jgi:O-antigen/teichoic acid export membrane protein
MRSALPPPDRPPAISNARTLSGATSCPHLGHRGDDLNPGRRLAVNTLANWSGTTVATLSSLLLAPFLLQHLGAERFGLYQVARQLVAYFLLLNLGIAGSVVRFTSEAVAARDHARVNSVINSAMALYLGVALAGLIAGLATGYLAPGFFRVAPRYVAETHALIWALGVWWALGTLTSPARAILIGQQRYGWINLVMAAGWLLVLALIVGLFELGHVSLQTVGIAFAGAAAAELCAHLGLVRRLQPSLRWTLRLTDRRTLRRLCRFGAWNLLFTVSGLFLWWTDNIVIGRLLGPAAVPLYALPFMLITLGRVVVTGLSTPLVPLAAAQAREGSGGVAATLVRSTRHAVILTLASTGLLLVAAEDVFRLWIGPAYASSWLTYACLWGSFWAVFAQMPAYHILLGAGDIRRPAAVVLAATGLALLVKIAALGWFGQGVLAVALVNWLCVLPVMAFYVPRCACQLARLPLARLYREAYLPPLLAFLPVAALGWLLFERWAPANLLELGGAFGTLVAGYLAVAFWTTDVAERAALCRLARQFRDALGGRRASDRDGP